ncbi:MAG: DUF805 domain-containing protein [Prevotella sp.]|nr:DUF805 domain-containing protein [Prevotella sp.]
MKKLIAKPQLGFGEAVKLACSRITQMSGRSRRSEFWWFMLAFIVCYFVLSNILSVVLSIVAAQVLASLIMLIALPITARRLQDSGKSRWWVIISWLANTVYSVYFAQSDAMENLLSVNPDPTALMGLASDPVFMVSGLIQTVTALATFIFCLLDSTPGPNKYGESPKYVVLEQDDEPQKTADVQTI